MNLYEFIVTSFVFLVVCLIVVAIEWYRIKRGG